MNRMNQDRQANRVTGSVRAFVPAMLALGLALFAAGNVHAVVYSWTNTASDVWSSTTAWSPSGAYPSTAVDGAMFTNSALIGTAFTVSLTADTVISNGVFSAHNAVITLDLGNNLLNYGSTFNSGGPVTFQIGKNGNTTTTVYVASSTVAGKGLVQASGGRFAIGGGGTGYMFVTNGLVNSGSLFLATGSASSGNKLVVSGANTFWTNNNAIILANVSGATNNSLVISNSASMTVGTAMTVGGLASFNSVLLDNGSLTTKGTSIGNNTNCIGNAVTVQDGGVWNNNGGTINIGTAPLAFNATNNSLTVGNNGLVTNVTFVNVGATNSLSFQGGKLVVSGAVTNSGLLSGSGTIVGNVVLSGIGSLSPGTGTQVGNLTLSNNLTLVSGSTTKIKLDSSQTGSNDSITVVGTWTIAGTLTVVTNGVAPLQAGDIYNIGITGGFSSTNLPALNPAYRWNNVTPGILAVVPQEVVPGITGPTNQVVDIGSLVTISVTVTGVPSPDVYWQFNGSNTTDGATGSGSFISGSATTSLTISNAQSADTGTYCIIATNSVGAATNCMTLTVSSGDVAPSISGVSDQTVIQGNNGTFNAAVAGAPTPTVQWFENGATITGATGVPLILTNVQYSQDGFVYSLVASNVAGTATTNMTLHVIITPSITNQPQSLVVTNTQSASFSVGATGVPAPSYQWFFNNTNISGATSSTYTIASAVVSNSGTYKVQVSNAAGTVTSSNATLTVNSTMSAALTPSNGALNVCYDTPLYMAFDKTPFLSGTGTIKIYNVTNSVTPVDTIDTGLGNLQSRTIGGETFSTYPVIITSNAVAIYPHLGVLTSNQTYYVTVDPGTFVDTNAALYAGMTTTNGWVFTTKPTGPANPNNVTVAADGSGDFCTVQGALDSLPNGNTTYTLVNIRNGTYTELVDTHNKNNITLRGQSRSGTVIQYTNNSNNNGSTHFRMSFKVNSNDIGIENLTLVNTTPQGGSQAEALMLESGVQRFIFNNAEVDSRQDTILANGSTQAHGYFYNSLVQGNFDYVWGGGNLFFGNCEIRTITGSSGFNLTASRTDNGTTPGGWLGPDGRYASNGFSFVRCQLTRSSSSITNCTLADSNGTEDGLSSFIFCSIETNCYRTPSGAVLSSQILWESGNSNLDNTASASFGLSVLTNGDTRLDAATNVTTWLYGWTPQLAPNILTNPVSVTVTAGVTAAFNVVATGLPDPSYQWLFNTTNVLAGATNASLSISNALAANAGTYSVIVSNSAGSVTSSNATLTVVGTGPTASFTASPTSGTEPLGVTFTDASAGSPNITLFWDFGDSSQATNAGGSSFVHTYAAGTHTVTLTASNAFGPVSTLVSNNLINVVTAFQAWQQQYFGCTACPQAQPNADPYGKGMSNFNQFLAGLNPTNPASLFQVTSTAQNTTDVVIVWKAAGVRTNAVQATTGGPDGSYSTNGFADISGPIILGVPGDTTTNYTDAGGATNSPSRYYRIRLVP